MARAQRWGARWVALLLGVALVASAVVAYALIRVTAPTADGDQAVASTQDTVPASASVSPLDQTVSSADTQPGDRTSADTVTPQPSSTPAATTAPSPDSSAATTPSPQESSAVTSSSPPDSLPTLTSQLAGSDVILPAAWSGRAKVTVTVLGRCATGSSSVYTKTPANLALDLPQNEASAVAPTATSRLPDNEPTLTLGVNASQVPSLAVYSSAVDDSGAFHRYWRLRLTPGTDRTEIHGIMLKQPQNGPNPNIMVDAETSLQPCETAGTVGLPRVLAAGSTLSGWISQTNAMLTLKATTTDGKRAVTVELRATRQE